MKSLYDFKFSDIKGEVVIKSLIIALVDTIKYLYCLYSFVLLKKSYAKVDIFDDDVRSKIQLYSLGLIFKLYSESHYRSPSFKIDLIDNLRNVAVPGTGIPLSIFCYNWYMTFAFVMIINPLLCFMGAVHKAWKHSNNSNTFILKTFEYYSIHLLQPDDWFSLWRINCAFVSYHSLVLAKKQYKEKQNTSDDSKSQSVHDSYQDSFHHTTGYKQENKWTFLVDGHKMGVPVSPFLTNIESIVCKNINIEGGMGIHFFKNAAHGGEWILQERLTNATWLSKLLPTLSPLSTMRIITTSTWSLTHQLNAKAITMSPSIAAILPNSSSDTCLTGSNSTSCTPKTSVADSTWRNVELDNMDKNELSVPTTVESNELLKETDTSDTIVNDILNDLIASVKDSEAFYENHDNINNNNMTDRMTKINNHDGQTKLVSEQIENSSNKYPNDNNDNKKCNGNDNDDVKKYIKPVSAVLRLGRANAKTDHSSVLFNVDMTTGEINYGTTNHHWYQLGLGNVYTCPWLNEELYTHHPDAPYPEVKGKSIPNINEAINIVTNAHMKLMPDVPVVGWDVAFTPTGVYLLEVNLSCNFFKGKFDINEYAQFVHSYFSYISITEEQLK